MLKPLLIQGYSNRTEGSTYNFHTTTTNYATLPFVILLAKSSISHKFKKNQENILSKSPFDHD